MFLVHSLGTSRFILRVDLGSSLNSIKPVLPEQKNLFPVALTLYAPQTYGWIAYEYNMSFIHIRMTK